MKSFMSHVRSEISVLKQMSQDKKRIGGGGAGTESDAYVLNLGSGDGGERSGEDYDGERVVVSLDTDGGYDREQNENQYGTNEDMK